MATTPYHIRIAPAAKRHMQAFTVKQQKNIIKLIEALAVNPRPPGAKKIEGMMGLYSYSEDVNHTRLVYKVEEQEVLVLLVRS